MTTVTVELCGNRWREAARCPNGSMFDGHRCDLDAGHADNAPHIPRPCRCRCDATTTTREGRES